MSTLPKLSTKYSSLFFAVFCFLITNAYGKSQSNLRHSSVAQTKTAKSIEIGMIPKMAHFMILGNVPSAHRLEMVRVSRERIEADGWQTILWRNDDVERLVEGFGDARLSQSWKWVKDDLRGETRLSKMEDFIKPLIMYVHGGVYLEADMVPCESLEYMVDEPRVVSFPMQTEASGQINTGLMSAPAGHPLMKLTLDEFIGIGQDITWLEDPITVGSERMTMVLDMYMEINAMDMPLSFSDIEFDIFDDKNDIVVYDQAWAKIADVRFMKPQSTMVPSTYHLDYESEIPMFIEIDISCYEHPEYIEGFMREMCIPEHRSHEMRFHHCGVNQANTL